jgi:glycosyltransferase involved in cell wall biosynthesis
MIKVTHYQRKPLVGMFSLENLFSDIRRSTQPDLAIRVCESSFASKGILPRFLNIIEAVFRQGDINHITGDVHYLSYLLSRNRTILTILDCVSLERLTGIKYWILWLLWYWLPIHSVGAITVISESTKKELLKYVRCSPDRIKVIHCCVSNSFQPTDYTFNYSYPTILQIGTGSHNKNIERVARALRGIRCLWTIVGSLSEDQLAIIKECEIDYENYTNLNEKELLLKYQQSDMLVFASIYEGFGLPIIEANAVGRPVVTSALYSMPEVAGNAACLVDPYSVRGIREGILKVINEPEYRAELVREGFVNVERFRVSLIAEQYANLYRNMLSSKKT